MRASASLSRSLLFLKAQILYTKDTSSILFLSLSLSLHSFTLTLPCRYAYDDWALSRIAAYLNNSADETLFLARGANYRNVWDPEKKFFCPRPLSNGSAPVFQCPKLLNDGMDSYYQVHPHLLEQWGEKG